jgi:hypothetical protein
MIMQYAARTRWMLAAGGVILVLNLFDAIFTIVYTRVGVAVESNPLMSKILISSPVLFMVAKLALVSLGVMLLWRLRHRRAAAIGLFATTTAYVTLIAYHLNAIEHLSLG